MQGFAALVNFISLQNDYLWVWDSWLDKRRHLNMSTWALGNQTIHQLKKLSSDLVITKNNC